MSSGPFFIKRQRPGRGRDKLKDAFYIMVPVWKVGPNGFLDRNGGDRIIGGIVGRQEAMFLCEMLNEAWERFHTDAVVQDSMF